MDQGTSQRIAALFSNLSADFASPNLILALIAEISTIRYTELFVVIGRYKSQISIQNVKEKFNVCEISRQLGKDLLFKGFDMGYYRNNPPSFEPCDATSIIHYESYPTLPEGVRSARLSYTPISGGGQCMRISITYDLSPDGDITI